MMKVLIILKILGCFIWAQILLAQDGNGTASHIHSTKPIYVVSHGWHTGIVLRGQDIQETKLGQVIEAKADDLIEIGWGDAQFYQNTGSEIDYQLALRAILWPTESVMHVVRFNKPVDQYFPLSERILLHIEQDGFDRLCLFIYNTFQVDEHQKAVETGEGLYGNSRFYKAHPSYYFPYTCNVWTAEAVEHAGLPLMTLLYQRAESLMQALKRIKSDKGY
ncbi:MAG: DUF2459 domain-containing protein [Caldithrix sp.]|nr:DUF2459 domain-containing protein [Caldithrix sp.]